MSWGPLSSHGRLVTLKKVNSYKVAWQGLVCPFLYQALCPVHSFPHLVTQEAPGDAHHVQILALGWGQSHVASAPRALMPARGALPARSRRMWVAQAMAPGGCPESSILKQASLLHAWLMLGEPKAWNG